ARRVAGARWSLPGAVRPAGAPDRWRGRRAAGSCLMPLNTTQENIISSTAPRSRREAREGMGNRPPKAVVGSQVSHEEEIFGKVYDSGVVRRLWAFVTPYRGKIYLAVGAVLAFTATQLAIPLIIRYAIDHGMQTGDTNRTMLEVISLGFAFVALINYGASWLQEMVIG